MAKASKRTDDDLFKETTMTFGEHLEELRSSLLKALMWLAVGFVVGLVFASWTVDYIKQPLERALKKYYAENADVKYQATAALLTHNGKPLPYTVDEVQHLINDEQYLYDVLYVHPEVAFDEIRRARPDLFGKGKPKRAAAKAALDPAKDADRLVPIMFWRPLDEDARIRITTLSVQESFGIFIKAALVVGVVLSSPMVFWHLWNFVAAGLYSHEKKYVHIFLPFSLGLFFLGAGMVFLVVFDPVLDFLMTFNRSMGLDPDPRISEWMGFVLILPLGFGIAFQLPLVMLFMERIGLFGVSAYLSKWRISIMVIVVLSAILTPADPYTLLFLAGPLTVLYFLGIGLCHIWPKVTGAGG